MATPKELGYNFISQSPYLQNDFVPNEITFNVSSPVNTGIFGPGINPFPIIPQEGEGDGGGVIGPKGNSKFDYEFEALGGLYNPDDVGLTAEEQRTLNMQKAKDAARIAGTLGMFALNPVSFLGKRAFNRVKRDREYKQEMKAYDQMIQQRNENRTAGTGGYQAGYSRDFMEGDGSSRDESQEASSPGSSGPGGSDTMGSFAYGGRAGYRSGKLVEGIMSFFKPKRAIDYVGFRSRKDIPLEQYSKMEAPITTKMMEEIPESELKKIFRTQELGLYSETPEILKAGNLMQRFTKVVNGKRVIDYDRAEDILNVKLRGNETLDELFKIEFRTRPVERAYGGIVGMYR